VDQRAIVKHSKAVSRLLRHTAGERGLAMTADGWSDVDEVCALLGIDRATLALAVEHNDKSRLQLDGDRVRACQGHSREGMPVTLEALEASWTRVQPVDLLWHGTSVAAIEGIALTGIEPVRRTHVHLAPATDSHVGRRTRVDLLLGIDPERRGAGQTGAHHRDRPGRRGFGGREPGGRLGPEGVRGLTRTPRHTQLHLRSGR
jgi:putative RNA 2'-phosphotransferase